MALIAYPYSAATQDLWLYQSETISYFDYNDSTWKTTTAEKPVAWNPGSPLYDYRRSLQGISLRKRFATSLDTDSSYHPYNNPADPANKWVYNNTYPMGVYAVSPRFALVCAHCFPGNPVYNPLNKWSGTTFPQNSLNDRLMSFSWMNEHNVVTDQFPTSQVIASFLSHPGYPSLSIIEDVELCEFPSSLSFEPLQLVNFLNLAPGATIWILDGAMKIIRSKLVQAGSRLEVSQPPYRRELLILDMAIKPDGTAAPLGVKTFLHDSGSVGFVEISPPSGPGAGDGVMGLIPAHVFGSFMDARYGDLPVPGTIGTYPPSGQFRTYMAERGYPTKPLRFARRQHQNLMLQSEADSLLQSLQAITIPGV
jgi:hypothetical protein